MGANKTGTYDWWLEKSKALLDNLRGIVSHLRLPGVPWQRSRCHGLLGKIRHKI